MTGLQNWFENSKVREFGYVCGRISTLTTPVRKRYQLDTCCLLKSNKHACIYFVLNKQRNRDAQIYYVFQNYLANNSLPLQMDLK